jgi:hypothetical protein
MYTQIYSSRFRRSVCGIMSGLISQLRLFDQLCSFASHRSRQIPASTDPVKLFQRRPYPPSTSRLPDQSTWPKESLSASVSHTTPPLTVGASSRLPVVNLFTTISKSLLPHPSVVIVVSVFQEFPLCAHASTLPSLSVRSLSVEHTAAHDAVIVSSLASCELSSWRRPRL